LAIGRRHALPKKYEWDNTAQRDRAGLQRMLWL